MLDIPSVSAIVAAVGVLVGVVFTYLEVRNLVKQRQTDLVMGMYRHFGSKVFQDSWQKIMNAEFRDYDDFVKNYGTADAWSVCMFFGGVGLLVYNEHAYLNAVDQMVSGPIKMTWEKLKPFIEGHRKKYDQPQFGEWFEYVYTEMEKRGKRLKFGKRVKLQSKKG